MSLDGQATGLYSPATSSRRRNLRSPTIGSLRADAVAAGPFTASMRSLRTEDVSRPEAGVPSTAAPGLRLFGRGDVQAADLVGPRKRLPRCRSAKRPPGWAVAGDVLEGLVPLVYPGQGGAGLGLSRPARPPAVRRGPGPWGSSRLRLPSSSVRWMASRRRRR